MPVNRDIIYYQEWTTSINNWRLRLEIVPAGNVSDLPATKARLVSSVISVKGAKHSFKDLPIAAWQAPTLQIDIDLEYCPDNLRLLLQDPIHTSLGEEVTNRFVLYSDRGDATLGFDDYFVEFVGVQPFSIGSKRDINAKTLKPKKVTVEVFDMMSVILQEFTTADFCGYARSDVYIVKSIREFIDVETPAVISLSRFPKDDGASAVLHFYSLNDTFGDALLYPLTWLNWPVWTRGDVGTAGVVTADGAVTDGVILYQQANDAAHNEGASLADALLLGLVTTDYSTASDKRIGGLFVPNDGGAEYQEYATMYDLLSDLAKCFWLKFRWQYGRYTQNSTNDNVSATLHWNRRRDNFGLTAYYDADITKAIGSITLEDCYNVVRTGEAELPNVGDDDIDKRVVETGGLRNSATWNVKMVHNNSPVLAASQGGFISGQNVFITNINLRTLCYLDGSEVRKIHESVTIDDGNAVTTHYSDIIPLLPETTLRYYNKWVSSTQIAETGLGYATAQHAVTVFGATNQSKLEVTLAMNADEGLLPSNVGEMFNLPAIDGEVSGTEWTLLEAEPDWQTGAMKCTFVSVGV